MRVCEGCPNADKPKVQGSGNSVRPPIMFVAESPGDVEVEKEETLIGPTGQFLRTIVRDLGGDPAEMYYTNTCLCHLSRKPTAEHVHACYEGLMDEIEEVRPKLIVPLGDVSAKAIGQYARGIRSSHCSFRYLRLSDGSKVGILPTYHPAAVFRSPDLFRDLAFDLERAIQIAVQGHPPYIMPPVENYEDINTYERLWPALDEMEDAKLLAIDLETQNRDTFGGRITDVGISWKRNYAVSIDWALIEGSKRAFQRLKALLERIPCSMQTGSFDYPWFTTRGITPRFVWDTEIGDWLRDERQGGHDLDTQATKYYWAPEYKAAFRKRFGIPIYVNDEVKFAELWGAIPDHPRRIYNCTDADYTFRLTEDQAVDLRGQGMVKLMKLLVEATKLYSELYVEGMCVDLDYVDELEASYQRIVDAEKAWLDKAAPGVNIQSSKQLAAYLYDELKLSPFGLPADNRPIPEDIISAAIQSIDDQEARDYWQAARVALYEGAGTKDEGRGLRSRSTSAYMLYYLAQQHEFPKHLIHYKRAKKAIATYVKNTRKFLWPDNRLRPDYKLDGTVAGRYKTSRPAVHNLTAGPELYNMFTAPPGYVILHADYHQADMRMMCHFSGDEVLLEWLKGDPHTEVVKEIGHLTDEDIRTMPKLELTKRRMAAKMVNFGLPYGRSAANLAPQMGMSVKEAREYIKAYWIRLRGLKRWMDSRGTDLMENGQELTSPFGNKRRFPLILNSAHKRECARLAVNFPVMASVNYLTTVGHIKAVKALREAGIDTKVYPHIHDSFNVCVPKADLREAVPIVAREMEAAPLYIQIDEVPFPVEVTGGFKWGTQTALYDGGELIEPEIERLSGSNLRAVQNSATIYA